MDNLNENLLNEGQEDVVDSQNIDSQEEEKEEESLQSEKTQEVAKPEQGKEENAKFAQERRDKEEHFKNKAKDELISEMYGDQGIHTYKEYQEALQKQREEEQRQKLIDNGIDPDVLKEAVASDPDVQWAKTFREKQVVEDFRNQVKDEKALLKDKPYFSDLETEIDTLVEDGLQKGQFINAEAAYKFLVGNNIDTLLSKSKDQATKQTLADVQDRANRGLTGNSDTNTDSDYTLSEEAQIMAAEMGVSPKNLAKRLANKIKK